MKVDFYRRAREPRLGKGWTWETGLLGPDFAFGPGGGAKRRLSSHTRACVRSGDNIPTTIE